MHARTIFQSKMRTGTSRYRGVSDYTGTDQTSVSDCWRVQLATPRKMIMNQQQVHMLLKLLKMNISINNSRHWTVDLLPNHNVIQFSYGSRPLKRERVERHFNYGVKAFIGGALGARWVEAAPLKARTRDKSTQKQPPTKERGERYWRCKVNIGYTVPPGQYDIHGP